MRWLLPMLLCGAAAAGTLVDRDGRVLGGDVEIDGGEAKVGRRTLAIEDVFLVEEDDGTLVYAPSFEARLRGYECIARDHLRDEYLDIVRRALGTRDYEIARQALELAEEAGLSGRELGKHKRRLEKKAGDEGRPSDRVRGMLRELEGYYGRLLVERAERAIGTRDGPRLLREALRVSPGSTRSRALLGKIAPEDFPVGDARLWLDWQVDILGFGAHIADPADVAVAHARRTWRRDLHGVRADAILMITPVKDSRVVGRALSYGRLSTNALAELFRTENPARKADHPLRILLFESKEEYLQQSGANRSQEVRASLEWTAGHYSSAERVSRFFWFADLDAERRIAGTCVHELTHQWLEERNPRVRRNGSDIRTPAYWIVEGFATFMEEGIFDIDAGEWTLFNPRSRSLDLIRVIPARSLTKWESFYPMSQHGFFHLQRDNEVEVQGRWRLRAALLSTSRIFYEQAGATCQFLYHAENGKHRRKLLDYLVAYYEGNAKRLDVEKAFGMSARELGANVVKFAHEVANGWRPKQG